MSLATRFGLLCGLLLCCLIFLLNIQSARCRTLQLHSALNIQRNMEIVKKSEALFCVGSIDCGKEWNDLRKHTKDDVVQRLRQTLKSLKPKELILSKGPTPPSSPNPGHNSIVLGQQNYVKIKDSTTASSRANPDPHLHLVIDRETDEKLGKLVHVESKPKGSTARPSGPSVGHNDHIFNGGMTSTKVIHDMQQKQTSNVAIPQEHELIKQDAESLTHEN